MKQSILLALAAALLAAGAAPGSEQNCYSVVAGRLATADGSVMLAHNEDNGIEYAARLRRVERSVHAPGEWLVLEGGGRVPRADTTFAYWFLEMPGLGYSHVLLNEHGVAVVSDNCPSREDRSDLTDGGIGPALRILVAERCRTSREGVKLVGSLVERFGYQASGRTLIICDAREGWLAALVCGRHWVAARVPDTRAALIANSYTIHEVDLADTLNFLGSADLVDYAVERGWYDPGTGEAFDFERAYAEPGRRVSPHQTFRQWSGIRHLAPGLILSPESGESLPFSVEPDLPVTASKLFGVLRDHYEGTPYETAAGGPHDPDRPGGVATICSGSTNSGSVFVLRSGMPKQIGILWWLVLSRPCTGAFMPLCLGLTVPPGQLGFEVDSAASRDPASAGQLSRDKAYRVFSDLSLALDEDYPGRIAGVRRVWRTFEADGFAIQQALEREALEGWYSDSRLITEVLDRYCQGVVARAVQQAAELLKGF
ncbi:MAG: C69 family dipeptidase [Candidatus Glassbacteria bacterium]|nr:C69 family dipeptidase [Candidatus Glassbacteria bacterium]